MIESAEFLALIRIVSMGVLKRIRGESELSTARNRVNLRVLIAVTGRVQDRPMNNCPIRTERRGASSRYSALPVIVSFRNRSRAGTDLYRKLRI